jgi:hypothetical protein
LRLPFSSSATCCPGRLQTARRQRGARDLPLRRH